jgi:hypothetical protein
VELETSNSCHLQKRPRAQPGGAETLTVPCLWVKLYQLCLKLRNFRNTATRDADVSNKRKLELFCPFKFVVRHPSTPISFRANAARPGAGAKSGLSKVTEKTVVTHLTPPSASVKISSYPHLPVHPSAPSSPIDDPRLRTNQPSPSSP